MNEVYTFVNSLFKAEAGAFYKNVHPNIELFNESLELLNTFFIEELKNSLGMIPMKEPHENEYYEEWKDEPIDVPRHLFKLSEYEHPKYGKLYLAYASNTNPTLTTSIKYFHCFYITKVDGDWKIVKMSILMRSRTKETKYWSSMDGYSDVSFTQAGKFIRTERYVEPSACEFSMKDYLKDK